MKKLLSDISSREKKPVGSALALAAGIVMAAKPAYADWGQGVDAILGIVLIYIIVIISNIVLLGLTRQSSKSNLSENAQVFVAIVSIVLGLPQVFLAILLPIILICISGLNGIVLLLPMAPIGILGFCLILPGIRTLKDRLPPAL